MKNRAEFLLAILFVLSTIGVNAQYVLSNDLSAIYIDGTSSIHDWTETVESMSGTLNVELDGSVISKVTGVNASIPVKSIKSGKGGMDDNTYAALKEKSHPNISYKLKSYSVQENVIHLTGMLTIAGVTKEVKFKSNYKVSGNQISFKANHAFKMTDFNIQPPTAIMGTIKTGDEVTIRLEMVFSK